MRLRRGTYLEWRATRFEGYDIVLPWESRRQRWARWSFSSCYLVCRSSLDSVPQSSTVVKARFCNLQCDRRRRRFLFFSILRSTVFSTRVGMLPFSSQWTVVSGHPTLCFFHQVSFLPLCAVILPSTPRVCCCRSTPRRWSVLSSPVPARRCKRSLLLFCRKSMSREAILKRGTESPPVGDPSRSIAGRFAVNFTAVVDVYFGPIRWAYTLGPHINIIPLLPYTEAKVKVLRLGLPTTCTARTTAVSHTYISHVTQSARIPLVPSSIAVRDN